jgi:hypothetical protein
VLMINSVGLENINESILSDRTDWQFLS